MESYNIENQGNTVFPGTYGYKLYEVAAKKLNKTIRHNINFDKQILTEVQNVLVKEIVNDFISIYYFYSSIPSCIHRGESLSQFSEDYSSNTSYLATMGAILKLAQKLYLNLLDLNLVGYLITHDKNYLGYEVIDAGEHYYNSVYQEMKRKGFDFYDDALSEDVVKFIKNVILAIQFIKNDCPVQLNCKDEGLTVRYHEVLRKIVDALTISLKDDYYDDILDAEKHILESSSNNISTQKNAKAKKNLFFKIFKMFV